MLNCVFSLIQQNIQRNLLTDMEYKLNMRRRKNRTLLFKRASDIDAICDSVLGRGLYVDRFSIKITSWQKAALKLAACVSYKQYTYTDRRVDSCLDYYMNVWYIKYTEISYSWKTLSKHFYNAGCATILHAFTDI